MKLKTSISSKWTPENGDFWYDLSKGGYLNPEDFLEGKDLKKVINALTTLEVFESLLEDMFEE